MPNHTQTFRFTTRGTKQLRFLTRWHRFETLDEVVRDVVNTGLDQHMTWASRIVVEQDLDVINAWLASCDREERIRRRIKDLDIDHEIPF